MEYEKIKQLIEDMGNSKLASISIEFPDGTKINMAKEESKQIIVENKKLDLPKEEKENMEKVKAQDENIKVVTSPMVGTFYSKPSPTAESYVSVRR